MVAMEEIKNKNYDDFDMVNLEGESTADGLFSPFTFIFFLVFLVLAGLLMLYSATFDVSVKNGFTHYQYLLNQVIGIACGIVVGLGLKYMPIRILKKSYALLCPFAIIILVLMLFPAFNDNGIFVIEGKKLFSGPVIGGIAVISLVSGTVPSIYNRKELTGFLFVLVLAVAITIAVLSGYAGGISYFFMISIVGIIMLGFAGAKRSYVILCSVFALATGLFIVLMDPDFFYSAARSIMPVPDPELYDHNLFVSQLAIKEGGISGIGIGKGLYKLGILQNVESTFIFASIAEEIGLIGILIFFIAYMNFFFLGLMASRRAFKKNDNFLASLSIGLSALILVQAILSGLYCSGFFPFGAMEMPFFSYGPWNEAIYISASFVLYRIIYMMGRGYEKR